MPSDMSQTNSSSAIPTSVSAYLEYATRKGRVPGFTWADRFAHWALRIPLIGMMLYYGTQKFPGVFEAPGDFGVPATLFILAAAAEILGPMALTIGGIVETLRPKSGTMRLFGDLMTRGGALAGVAAVGGVIAFFYWGSLTIADLQVMALGLSVFLLFRGNKYGRGS